MRKAIEMEKVGLLLVLGYSKKQIAEQLNKSIFTVSMQTRQLFKKSNSHNIADLTRYFIKKYAEVDVEDIIETAYKKLSQ